MGTAHVFKVFIIPGVALPYGSWYLYDRNHIFLVLGVVLPYGSWCLPTANVLIYMTVSLEGLVFAYNFNLQENKPKGSMVGTVLAFCGSSLFNITYDLKTHTDLFSVDTSGSILTQVELDMEAQKFYVISVEATDTRAPPNTALTVVAVQVENVNEMPVFDSNSYTAEIISIAPFKYPIVKVKATDPDVGESERLQYCLVEPSSLFAVEPSSGQVYVVSSAGERWNVTLQVRATDPHGLYATAAVEVTIKDPPRRDVVVISLNQEIDTVVNKTLDMEVALERALGWSVSIISISSSREGLALSRTTEIHSFQRQDTPKTFDSFMATDTSGTNVISKETVENLISKLSTSSTDTEPVISQPDTPRRGSFELLVDFDKPHSGTKFTVAD